MTRNTDKAAAFRESGVAYRKPFRSEKNSPKENFDWDNRVFDVPHQILEEQQLSLYFN